MLSEAKDLLFPLSSLSEAKDLLLAFGSNFKQAAKPKLTRIGADRADLADDSVTDPAVSAPTRPITRCRAFPQQAPAR